MTPTETDPRFPSGPWTGYFLMSRTGSRRHPTSSRLTFANGAMTGDGRDWVGAFTIDGTYDVTDGKCVWTKGYTGKHNVYYSGYNEGQGIWGTWDIPNNLGMADKGGFHIWPEQMPDPTNAHLVEQADLPTVVEEPVAVS